LGLVRQYQWNNILQLKAMNMFEDLLENNLLSVKIEIIRDGEVIERLVDMASQPNYRFP